MLAEKWAKIFSLVKKTGDKVIVFDETEDDSLVVMPLVQYEKLMSQFGRVKGLTEEEMLDRINQDIARWQSSQPTNTPLVEEFEKKVPLVEKEEDEERYYVEPIE